MSNNAAKSPHRNTNPNNKACRKQLFPSLLFHLVASLLFMNGYEREGN